MPEQEYEPFEPKPKKPQNKKPPQSRKWYTPIRVNTASVSFCTRTQWGSVVLKITTNVFYFPIDWYYDSINWQRNSMQMFTLVHKCLRSFSGTQKCALFTVWPLWVFDFLPTEFQITEGGKTFSTHRGARNPSAEVKTWNVPWVFTRRQGGIKPAQPAFMCNLLHKHKTQQLSEYTHNRWYNIYCRQVRRY